VIYIFRYMSRISGYSQLFGASVYWRGEKCMGRSRYPWYNHQL